MEAIILAVGMIAIASLLTFNHPAENRNNNNNHSKKNRTDLTANSGKPEKTNEPPYYERYISRSKNDSFLDYSGGMMGI